MNQAGSYLADRKQFHGAIQNERLQGEGSKNKKDIPATTGRLSGRLLVLTREFLVDQFKLSLLREAETAIKSWLGDVGVSISDSLWGKLSCFKQTII